MRKWQQPAPPAAPAAPPRDPAVSEERRIVPDRRESATDDELLRRIANKLDAIETERRFQLRRLAERMRLTKSSEPRENDD